MKRHLNLLFQGVIWLLFSFILGCARTPTANINLQAANYLNPDIYKHSSPVVVTIYQLKSSAAFQQANFFALSNNPLGTLGSDLLDKQEIELRPKQTQNLKIPLSPEANYIGIIGAFRDPDHAQWRKLVKIEPRSSLKLQVNLATQNVIAIIH
ncbi:MAG: type VI secretion system lipoprotein TssJ [Proteobacteria bacterium]|nr:type VI secretion system lipoprotein TssJ [Pseudomonadota bacterium]